MRYILLLVLFSFTIQGRTQSIVKGTLKDDAGAPVSYANVAMYNEADSNLIKVETSREDGSFQLSNMPSGRYFFRATFIGFPELEIRDIYLGEKEIKNLEVISFFATETQLAAVHVVAERAMVVVEADRTIFNVEGTANSVGSDALSLLRKAPSVTVDNTDNINVLGRSGVQVYVDGKALPLAGEDLSGYLKSLSADQIDRIEIITSPGAKYDAEGNAGIIDIRLKKDKNLGANGSINSTYTQGILTRGVISASVNFRNKKFNLFGTGGFNKNDNFHNILFQSNQNGIFMDEINNTQNNSDVYNYRVGTDVYLHKNHTLGFLVGVRRVDGEQIGYNRVSIADELTAEIVDSVLIGETNGDKTSDQNTYNVNYRFANNKGHSLTFDADYGLYLNSFIRSQPNRYYDPTETHVTSEVINAFDTPNDIEMYAGKIDYEMNIGKGKLGIGGKLAQVQTKNTFLYYDVVNDAKVLNDKHSNYFVYTEKVYAGYASLNHPLGDKIDLSAGLRAEQTYTVGALTTYLVSLQEPPSENEYLKFFPNLGLMWRFKEMQSFNFNYGRRINRPDYNVLNPFRNQRSVLSIEKGNPNLKPEIVNNVEIGYTLSYRYNFKLAYSRTNDEITRLIGPDETDPRAGFISWDNLATQDVWSLSASLPFQITKWWNAYLNLSSSHTNNQADYGNGAIVDVQVLSYMTYQKHTFNIYKDFKGEVSGYISGPGVWGGVFVYDANWSLDIGLQKQFMNKHIKARITANNIFNRFGWRGTSSFNGLVSTGQGRFDGQFVSASLSYAVGNQSVKSLKHNTGLDAESKRVGN